MICEYTQETNYNIARLNAIFGIIILFVMLILLSSCATKKPAPSQAPQIKINNNNGSAGNLIQQVSQQQLGVKYRYGGKNPDQGFDCSGLVLYSYQQALGVKLPRTAKEQAKAAGYKGKNSDDLVIGDLVVFNNFKHIGIYLGNNQFIHAPDKNGKVRIENLQKSYWQNNYDGGYSYFVEN